MSRWKVARKNKKPIRLYQIENHSFFLSTFLREICALIHSYYVPCEIINEIIALAVIDIVKEPGIIGINFLFVFLTCDVITPTTFCCVLVRYVLWHTPTKFIFVLWQQFMLFLQSVRSSTLCFLHFWFVNLLQE